MLQRTITAAHATYPGLHQLSGMRISVQIVKTGQVISCPLVYVD